MKADVLSNAGYTLDLSTQVWRRPGFDGIDYSDGDDIENRLLSIVSSAEDVGIFSPELQAACTDWPSRYHLSPARANLLRPIANQLKGDVLELGAGCGAITRFLGESGANVLALEGSARRALIARRRTRDLNNVAVVVDDIGQANIGQRFDVVTLIGVLEYAALFDDSETPAQCLLERCRDWLKPDGVLILAIENQLGLKYFAGAPEDHLGQPNYGLENRYNVGEPKTYGRVELVDLLRSARLPAHQWFAPFPDYKLPAAVISEAGLANSAFDAASLAAQTVGSDPQLPAGLVFQPERVWETVFRNGLGLDLANSFLLLAGANQVPGASSGNLVLGWHYNTGRAAAYCKETVFWQRNDRAIEAVCTKLMPAVAEPPEAQSGPLKFELAPSSDYIQGRLLWMDFVELMGRDDWSLQSIGKFFRQYLEMVNQLAALRGMAALPSDLEGLVDGRCFDWIPKNIILTATGDLNLIDEEWSYRPPLPLRFLLFRAMSASLVDTTLIGTGLHAPSLTPKQWVIGVMAEIFGEPMSELQFADLFAREVAVQQQVRGGLFDISAAGAWFDTPLRHKPRRLVTANQVFDAQVRDLEKSLDLVLSSRAWACTRPLRALHQYLRR